MVWTKNQHEFPSHYDSLLHKAKHYILATDLKPLVGVFKKSLEDIEDPRLLSIAEKTMWFKFKIIHVQGKLNNGPHYMCRQGGDPNDLSYQKGKRTSTCQYLEIGQQMEDALVACMRAALSYSEGLRAVNFDRLKRATKKDPAHGWTWTWTPSSSMQ